jgi:mevalonate kinase
MKQSYSANGKLLITGEYVIIDGALSFALPTSRGQHLTVETNSSGIISWQSYDNQNNCWFWAEFDTNIMLRKTSDTNKAIFLSKLLNYCVEHSNQKNKDSLQLGASIHTYLDFATDWGLGSSSTLLVLLSKLFQVDAFELHFSHTNGSGYDIACGIYNEPISYQLISPKKPAIESVNFNPSFKKQLYFVHLNQKQVSANEVVGYNELKKEIDLEPIISEVTQLTKRLIACENLTEFESILERHEAIISHVLQRNSIKETQFQLYQKGVIKSLGAWGGDFVMVTGTDGDMDYFRERGFSIILSYEEMILPYPEDK